MAYVKQNWIDLPNKTTPLSADRLNHLETQYDKAVGDVRSEFNPQLESIEEDISGLEDDVLGLSGQLEEVLEDISSVESPVPDARFFSVLESENSVIVFAGSSTTRRGEYVEKFTGSLREKWGPGWYGAIGDASPGAMYGVSVVNAGVSGTTSVTYLNPQRASEVSALNPSVVFHAIGSNDWSQAIPPGTVASNVESAIERISSSKEVLHVILHQHERVSLSTPSSYKWSDYGEKLKELSDSRNDCIFIDASDSFRKAGVFQGGGNEWGLLDPDNVHLTPLGGRVLGSVLCGALGIPAASEREWKPLPGNSTGGVTAQVARYILSGSVLTIEFRFTGGVAVGGVDVWENLPSWLSPKYQATGLAWTSDNHLAMFYVRANGTAAIHQQSGASRNNVRGSVTYNLREISG